MTNTSTPKFKLIGFLHPTGRAASTVEAIFVRQNKFFVQEVDGASDLVISFRNVTLKGLVIPPEDPSIYLSKGDRAIYGFWTGTGAALHDDFGTLSARLLKYAENSWVTSEVKGQIYACLQVANPEPSSSPSAIPRSAVKQLKGVRASIVKTSGGFKVIIGDKIIATEALHRTTARLSKARLGDFVVIGPDIATPRPAPIIETRVNLHSGSTAEFYQAGWFAQDSQPFIKIPASVN
jgi:hypothetical protein